MAQPRKPVVPERPRNVRLGREVFRIGVPIELSKLLAVIGALDPPEGSMVRHFNGLLIVEANDPSLLDGEAST